MKASEIKQGEWHRRLIGHAAMPARRRMDVQVLRVDGAWAFCRDSKGRKHKVHLGQLVAVGRWPKESAELPKAGQQ